MRKGLSFLLAISLLTPAWAGFFNSEKETGWFWKKEPKEEKEKKEKEKIEKKPVILPAGAERKREQPPVNKDAELLMSLPETITEEDLDKLTPTQVGKLWELYYERALWQPNEKDYENLLRIQSYAIKKSEMHFVALQEVLRRHPEWNPNVKRPIVTYGRRVSYRKKQADINEYLQRYKDRAGLYFFFESNCKFCQAQASLLKTFQRLTGWEVLPISVDGICLPEYPECQPDRGLAEKFGITVYPAIYLVVPNYKDGKPLVQPVSYGLITIDELKETIYLLLYTAENGHPPEVEKKEWEKLREKPRIVKAEIPQKLAKIADVLNKVREEKVKSDIDNLLWGEQ